jgi:hypothetical protein
MPASWGRRVNGSARPEVPAERAGPARRSWGQKRNREISMADDKTKRAPQDAKLISLEEDYEVEYWTQKYGVTGQRLTDAVKSVGHSAEKVGEHLKRH